MKQNAASNEFLIEANTTLEQHSRVYFNYLRSQIDNILYYRLYTQWPDEFELSTVNAQISWLYQISNQEVEFREECKYKKIDKKDSSKAGPLQEFDVVHCNYHSELNLLFGSINVDCSRMTGKIDLSATKLTIRTKQGDRDDENFLDQYQGSSVEYGYKKGFSYGNGPIKMEAKIGVIGHLEFDRKGLSDGWISAGADVKVGTNIITPYEGGDKMSTINGDGEKVDMDTSVGKFKDPSISIMGTEAKLTMSGGTSVEGKGIFSNVGK